ncbi:MAG: hypothetical protein ACRDS1_00345 [Pseudonocardiaceae bacterium]
MAEHRFALAINRQVPLLETWMGQFALPDRQPTAALYQLGRELGVPCVTATLPQDRGSGSDAAAVRVVELLGNHPEFGLAAQGSSTAGSSSSASHSRCSASRPCTKARERNRPEQI